MFYLPIKSDDRNTYCEVGFEKFIFNKVIAMASERGMVGVVSSACKVMGMRALKSDRIGTAMGWALRSQDVQFTTFLADQLLGAYCKSGEFTSSDLLDHLGQSMVVSDRLTFLAKYREFHKLCEQVRDTS